MLSKSDTLRALKKLGTNYQKVSRNVASLEGDNRYELLGFIDVFNRAISEFTEEERHELYAYFAELEKNNVWWKKVLAIITNKYTLFMFACYTASVFFAAAGPVIALICGAIGMSVVIPGLKDLAEQTLRLKKFIRSGKYDQDIYGRYLANITVAAVMYAVWASAAVPSFTRNLVNVRTNAQVMVIAAHHNGSRLLQVDKGILAEEAKILWNSVWYNGRDMGLDAISDHLTKVASTSNSLIPAVASSFLGAADHFRKQHPPVFKFSELLRISREMAQLH